jgi:hypothetical protein
MQKTDLSKLYKEYYTAKTSPLLVHLKPAKYISINGKGDPSGAEFSLHIQALYSVAYGIKFDSKKKGRDFVVAKLEGLWQFDEKKYGGIVPWETPLKIPRSEWSYKLLIRLPEFVSASDVEEMISHLKHTKPSLAVSQVSYFEMEEGKSLQMMHLGPFDTEPESLRLMHHFMSEHGLERNGLHHEIYLSDFRKTSPDKLRTILRQPIK